MCLPLTELIHYKFTPLHTNSAVEDATITQNSGRFIQQLIFQHSYYATIAAFDCGIKIYLHLRCNSLLSSEFSFAAISNVILD
jgi:hypothetical protein